MSLNFATIPAYPGLFFALNKKKSETRAGQHGGLVHVNYWDGTRERNLTIVDLLFPCLRDGLCERSLTYGNL